jgi:choline dehydrogenase
MVRIYHISGKDRYCDPPPAASIRIRSIGGSAHPASRGSCHVQSGDSLAHPRIQPNYLSHPEDRETALALLRLVRRIAPQAPLRPRSSRSAGPTEVVDDDALDYVRETGQIPGTPSGRVAWDRPAAVVDARLRARREGPCQRTSR